MAGQRVFKGWDEEIVAAKCWVNNVQVLGDKVLKLLARLAAFSRAVLRQQPGLQKHTEVWWVPKIMGTF